MPDIMLHDLNETTYAAIRRAAAGGTFRGTIASLSTEDAKPAPRRLGDWKGLVRVAPDFDEWPDDLAEAFGI